MGRSMAAILGAVHLDDEDEKLLEVMTTLLLIQPASQTA